MRVILEGDGGGGAESKDQVAELRAVEISESLLGEEEDSPMQKVPNL